MNTNNKNFNTVRLYKNRRTEMQFRTKDSVLNISTTLSGVISHARLFITGQLWNPWQMLAEPKGSAEPWLKIIDVGLFS